MRTRTPGPGMKYCDATSKQTKEPCGQIISVDQAKCHYHGGASRQAKRAALQRKVMAEALAEIRKLGGSVDVEPGEAMLAMVQEAAHNVAVYRHLVQQLELAVGGDEALAVQEWGEPGRAGIKPHPFLVAYDAEREKLVTWSKRCLDAGVAERRVRLAEAQADQLVGVTRDVVDGMVAALVAAGLPAVQVAEVAAEALPKVMRAAFEKAASIDATNREVERTV